MFWDRVAGVYDLFANFYNAGTHKVLCQEVASLVSSDDEVLECACGTGMLTRHIAPACKHIVATDFSGKMLERARHKCRDYGNASFEYADILHLDYPDGSFDKVVAANVIHLLDEPLKALSELDRVCRKGGRIIIPTYMNREKGEGKTSGFATAVGKAGADFKRQFTFSSYQQFFAEAGYKDASFKMIEGRVPCAIAVLSKKG
jgi:ubiquinone/menaquinone biosynthesis C-methylase UbiE